MAISANQGCERRYVLMTELSYNNLEIIECLEMFLGTLRNYCKIQNFGKLCSDWVEKTL